MFTGFPGREVLFDGMRVIGVRTGDRGVAKDGTKKAEFEPGVEIHAKVTIFCDGVRGNLTKEIVRQLGLSHDREPEQYAVGLKELWEIPKAASRRVPSLTHSDTRFVRMSSVVGSSMRCRTGASHWASWSASITTIRSSIRTWRSTASSSIRSFPSC